MWLYFRDLMDENIKKLTEEIFFSPLFFFIYIHEFDVVVRRCRSTLYFLCVFVQVFCCYIVLVIQHTRRVRIIVFLLFIHNIHCLVEAWSLFYLRNACPIFSPFFVLNLFKIISFSLLYYCFLHSFYYTYTD